MIAYLVQYIVLQMVFVDLVLEDPKIELHAACCRRIILSLFKCAVSRSSLVQTRSLPLTVMQIMFD
jgi:hypothetical protein